MSRNRRVSAAMRHPDLLGAGAAKRKKLHGRDKVHSVMAEFKRGTLRSGSGEHVASREQAIAIAMSEAGMEKRHRNMEDDGHAEKKRMAMKRMRGGR